MTDWQSKWEEYCAALDDIAFLRAKLNFMEKMEKRMYSLAYREATGTVKEREAAFYASPEYEKFIQERNADDEKLQRAYATKDKFNAFSDLYRTDKSYEKEALYHTR